MNNFLQKLKSFFDKARMKFAQFMVGRYGADELYKALSVLILVLIGIEFLLSLFGLTVVCTVLSVLIWLLIVLSLLRVFSKNIARRNAENIKYFYYKNKWDAFVKLQKNRWRDRKTHIYRRCPSCKTVLRLPNKKGKHTVVCPKCGGHMNVRKFF